MNIVLIKSYTDKPWRSPETYQLMEDSLNEKWEVVSVIPSDEKSLCDFLEQQTQLYSKPPFVFNVAEYIDEENKQGFLPALLDEWQVPHLGSSAQTAAIGLDKARTKNLLKKHHVPTPDYFVVSDKDSDLEACVDDMTYPLIVKPLKEGGHIGINDDSIVYERADLENVVTYVLERYQQPALVEKYITGDEMREFSVGIIDNDGRFFTPVEIDYEAMGVECKILSYEAAQKDLEKIRLVEDKAVQGELLDLSERTFAAVGAQDYSRVDLRMDQDACYVLEINIMPGLGQHSFLPDAAKDIHNLEYAQLIKGLAANSMKRQGLLSPDFRS